MADRLSVSRTVTLDSAGRGVITIGPDHYRESWTVQRMTTQGASTIEPVLKVTRYGAVIDLTKRGNFDGSDSAFTVQHGETIQAEYTGGTAGALMTFYLEGETSIV